MSSMLILNKTKSPLNRYQVIHNVNAERKYDPSVSYYIVAGINRGNGWSKYLSITDLLKNETAPQEAKDNLKNFLRERGYGRWLTNNGYPS